MRRKLLLVSDNTEIYYEIVGAGSPLVLLHGNSESGRVFGKQVAFFKKFYKCIVIDSRGHGRSEKKVKDLEFERMSRDVKEILDYENIKRASVLGFSDGGNVAARFVVDYPLSVEKLILNSANLTVNGLYIRWRILSKLEIILAKILRQRVAVKNLLLKETKITNCDLAKILQPTLILVGQHDVVSEAYSKELAQQIPHSELSVIPSAKHSFLQKSPKLYNKIILKFLRKPTA